jgi:hypothetical protein
VAVAPAVVGRAARGVRAGGEPGWRWRTAPCRS